MKDNDLEHRLVMHEVWQSGGDFGWQPGMMTYDGYTYLGVNPRDALHRMRRAVDVDCHATDDEGIVEHLPNIEHFTVKGGLLEQIRMMVGDDDRVRVYRVGTGQWVAQVLSQWSLVKFAEGADTEGKVLTKLWLTLADERSS